VRVKKKKNQIKRGKNCDVRKLIRSFLVRHESRTAKWRKRKKNKRGKNKERKNGINKVRRKGEKDDRKGRRSGAG